MPISCLPETVLRTVASRHLSCSRTHQAAPTDGFFSPLIPSVFITWSFLKGNLSCFLLYLFLIVYFCQRAPMDIYFILRVVAIGASAFSCCSIDACFGYCACLWCSLNNLLVPIFFSLHLEYSLNSGTTKCSHSSCAFLALMLEAAVSPGNCSFVLWFTGE